MKKVVEEWFGEWFNSPYYHILYKNRDFAEAKKFIDNLIGYFQVTPDHKVLDLACGKGRHSVYMNEKGFEVVGVDLSAHNIEYAKQFENAKLKFYEHDMREVFAHQEFDFILNLFTSFGYFGTEEENEKTISSVAKGLRSKGAFLIDFLNPHWVIRNMVPHQTKVEQGIEFKISKELSKDGFIIKNIEFADNGKLYKFYERVKILYKEHFFNYFDKAGLQVVKLFGDYDLNDYDEKKSERMIFIARSK
ncbi:class I SAM-dependent methyltransferase [Fulvivirga sediminis]|uniref:Class I SAM-dependent methyltransferase n=1 Tax=Fulvivirga sediminis TaxID=2803949 RepID=A0A937JXL3_9BACT|nr:class I SAM-dependent methyltransferase [Fulvivirga sediminis]MBL3654744.1 class I SAM-dependent methyltransferase [Fulvivirga sediminis]